MPNQFRSFRSSLVQWALQLLIPMSAMAASDIPFSYTAYQFESAEQWRIEGRGNLGNSQWDGKKLRLDFAQGAEWISLVPPDRSLQGNVKSIKLKLSGTATGHPIHLFVNTHFMTFHKIIGELNDLGPSILEIEAPPGPGWEWFEGENDGERHGPLRIGEIRFEAAGRKDRCEIKLADMTVEGIVPANKRVLLTARGSTDESSPSFRVELRSLADIPLTGKLSWKLRDWTSQELGQGSQSVKILPRMKKLSLIISAPKSIPSRKFIEAEISLILPGQETPIVKPCWLAPPYQHQDVTLAPDSPFGMGIYLGRYKGAEMVEVARKAREAGVKWSREDFEWQQMEPRPGEFYWEHVDHLLKVAKENGITVYAIVAYFPQWSKGYTDEGVEQYVDFLRQLVKRYKVDIHYWEIWNEPNIFFWQGPKELYAKLLINSFQAIKEMDPSAQVLGISTAGIDYGFIEKMLALKTPFDILTIHPYRKMLEDAVFIQDLKKASELVKPPGGSPRPVWLTEMGWATHTPHNAAEQDFQPVTLRSQAELIARSYLCSIVSGVEPRTFWYDFRDDGDDSFYFEHTLGILYRDFQPKPAYASYATMARLLKNKKLAGPLVVPNGTFGFQFTEPQDSNRLTMAIWNPDRDASIQLTVPEGEYVCVNTIGEENEAKPSSAGSEGLGRVLTLDLKKGAPLYLVRK